VSAEQEPRVDLFWLPLGAGGHSVRLNGRVYEAFASRRQRRAPLALFHSALEVVVPEGRFVIEMAPVRDGNGAARGVVAEGPVGSRQAGRLRLFRYEVRCWPGGEIPDVVEAVGSPRRLSEDGPVARRILDAVPTVPRLTWGRDEARVGEMWNSNSLVSWLIVLGGLDVGSVPLPEGGRAPGWDAGVAVARQAR
jgi:hypothetical protein